MWSVTANQLRKDEVTEPTQECHLYSSVDYVHLHLSYQTNKLNFALKEQQSLPVLCFKNILQISFQDNPLSYKGKYQGVFDSSLNYV